MENLEEGRAPDGHGRIGRAQAPTHLVQTLNPKPQTPNPTQPTWFTAGLMRAMSRMPWILTALQLETPMDSTRPCTQMRFHLDAGAEEGCNSDSEQSTCVDMNVLHGGLYMRTIPECPPESDG